MPKLIRTWNSDAVNGEAVLFFLRPRRELAQLLITFFPSVIMALDIFNGGDVHRTVLRPKVDGVLAWQQVDVTVFRVLQGIVKL